MNKNYLRFVGPPKDPTARRGIHDHCDRDNNMVRFNSDETDETEDEVEENISNDDEVGVVGAGVDEVDYSLHKSRKFKTKVTKNQRQKLNRNSLNLSHEDQIFTDDRCRWQNTSLPSGLNTPEQELSFSSDNQSGNISHHNISVEDKQGVRKLPIFLIVTALIAVATGIWWNQNGEPSFVGPLVDGQKFINELTTLGEQYSIKEDTMLLIQSGISTIFQNQDAGSFVFVYNSNTKSFDKNMFNNFITNIAVVAARYLRKDSKSAQQVEHIEIEPSKLGIETHSELIQKYREEVSRTGLMLVKDIDKLPSNLAMAFHYYCDEYNPLVKGSAIFFTLDMANCSSPAQQPPNHAYIEKCLAKKWTSLPKDNIGPLLTRVVGTIVDTTRTI